MSRQFSTKIAAQAELTRLLAAGGGQHAPTTAKTTIATIVAAYVANRRARGAAQTTIAGYETIARRLDDAISRIPIARLSVHEIDAFYARLRARGINLSRKWQSQSTRTIHSTSIHHTHNLMRAACRWAMRSGQITRDPMLRVEVPKRTKSQASALQIDDVKALLSRIAGHRLEAPLLFALATGMRRGEICGLQRASIDMRAKTVNVKEARAKKGNGWEQKTTKTNQRRTIPLNVLALKALKIELQNRAVRAELGGEAHVDSGFAFSDELGDPIAPDALTDAFRNAFAHIERSTGRHQRLHDLRHTAASLMLSAGIDIGAVKEVLGHTETSTTLNVYGHLMEGAKGRAVEAIDEGLRPKTSRSEPRRTRA